MSHTVALVVPADADVEGVDAGGTVEVDEGQSVLGAAHDEPPCNAKLTD